MTDLRVGISLESVVTPKRRLTRPLQPTGSAGG